MLVVCGGREFLWQGLVFQFEYYEFLRLKDPQYLRILDFSAGVDTHVYWAATDISDTHSTAAYFPHDTLKSSPISTMGFYLLPPSCPPPKSLFKICFWLNTLCHISLSYPQVALYQEEKLRDVRGVFYWRAIGRIGCVI
ncbi:MAG: hypothetical protein ISP37_05675 [Planktomarina sp.]|uniref:hypothetical protein n=1 Tax=Planktomarina sp. TaxID=2024851 RepID=UPI003260C215|nr:hypothetical protein [Planktomarina sp.]